MGDFVVGFDELVEDLLCLVFNMLCYLICLVCFGLCVVLLVIVMVCWFYIEWVCVLFGGVVVYVYIRLDWLLIVLLGLMILVSGYCYGWLVVWGGFGLIMKVLVVVLDVYGGIVVIGVIVISCCDIFDVDIVMFDFSLVVVFGIYGDVMFICINWFYWCYCVGLLVFKVDFVIEGDVGWINFDCWCVGIVYLGGIFVEIVDIEC